MTNMYYLISANYVIFHVLLYREVMEVPGDPLSEEDARKYLIDLVLGMEYCKCLLLVLCW